MDFLSIFSVNSSLMPSLHRRAESPYWVVSFQSTDGRWLKKSTKTKERALALKIAVEWEKAAHGGRAGRLVETQVRKVFNELLEQATGEPMHFHSCREWFNEFLANKAGVTAESTLIRYRQVFADFLTHLGNRANLPLSAISPADVRSFRDSLAEGGRAISTVNMVLRKVLSIPFTAAYRLGYISVNPCLAVESLRDNDAGEADVFTPEQVRALLAASAGDWNGAILAGYLTGLRLRDIVNMTWGSVDFETGVIRITTGKTGTKLVLPLHQELSEWLAGQPRGIARAPVFPSLAGKSGAGRNGHSMTFKRIMAKAGIKGRITRNREEGSAGRTRSSLSFHSLRHSFNSALANAGVAQETRQKLTGHASAAMNARYTHHEVETLRAAVEKLPRIGGADR